MGGGRGGTTTIRTTVRLSVRPSKPTCAQAGPKGSHQLHLITLAYLRSSNCILQIKTSAQGKAPPSARPGQLPLESADADWHWAISSGSRSILDPAYSSIPHHSAPFCGSNSEFCIQRPCVPSSSCLVDTPRQIDNKFPPILFNSSPLLFWRRVFWAINEDQATGESLRRCWGCGVRVLVSLRGYHICLSFVRFADLLKEYSQKKFHSFSRRLS